MTRAGEGSKSGDKRSERSSAERQSAVRALLAGAREIASRRATWTEAIARTTGLSAAGVELGFTRHLETEASDADLDALVLAAGDASIVHVVLSANVFTAPLRAIAIARAAAPRVVVRPSRRDPVLARALVEAARDPAITIDPELDVAAIEDGELHVYGRDETIALLRARARSGVVVRGHGAGMGVALVSPHADLTRAAEALADDVVAFDQRGCLSPRIAIAVGPDSRARELSLALHEALLAVGARVPRGALTDDEREDRARWLAAVDFAGTALRALDHVVGFVAGAAPLIPPSGRHVHVCAAADESVARAHLAPFARFIVAVGSDDPAWASALAPSHARVSPLGAMQRPPLDGPVDRRRP
jgi:acyl-CoA reductase-like NAD-dependent aldehyde dehydrogenase